MNRLRVSVIGYGFAAKAFHLPIILNNENYELKQIMTRNKTRQKEIKELYPNVEIITNYDDAIKNKNIDLVVIATTNDVHYEYTKKALENNKNVICEKPFVPTYKEALELFDLAKKNNLILKVYHNRKYNGDILTLKELMKNVDFGKLLSFESRYDRLIPEVSDNWRFKDNYMAGLFYDLGPHIVHNAVDLFGIPKSVFAQLYLEADGILVDDHFEIILNYKNGFKVFLGAEMFLRDDRAKLRLVGTKHSYVKYGHDVPDSVSYPIDEIYQESNLKSLLIDNNQTTYKVDLLKGKHFLFYEDFYNDFINKNYDNDDVKLNLAVVLIMEKALESYKKGEIIKI